MMQERGLIVRLLARDEVGTFCRSLADAVLRLVSGPLDPEIVRLCAMAEAC